MENLTISFEEEISSILKELLKKTTYLKADLIDQRATQLMEIHKTYIDIAKNKLGAKTIATSLFLYEIKTIR
jgi:hypothetical protein